MSAGSETPPGLGQGARGRGSRRLYGPALLRIREEILYIMQKNKDRRDQESCLL